MTLKKTTCYIAFASYQHKDKRFTSIFSPNLFTIATFQKAAQDVRAYAHYICLF